MKKIKELIATLAKRLAGWLRTFWNWLVCVPKPSGKVANVLNQLIPTTHVDDMLAACQYMLTNSARTVGELV